jgi:hypothetical protein
LIHTIKKIRNSQVKNDWWEQRDKGHEGSGFKPSNHFLRSQQRVVATVEDSVLKMEIGDLESQEEDANKRFLFFKPMSWLG